MTLDCIEKLSRLFPTGVAGLVFDCDGVMIDSEEANRAFYNIILNSLGLPSMTDEQEKFAFMATAKIALLRMLPEKYHERLDEIIRDNIDYARDILPNIRLMPGYREFVAKCHILGVRLAIDTNRTDFGIQAILRKFDLEFFDPVITCVNAEPKPSSQGARMICDNWQVSPQKILFFGDSPTDMAAARGAYIPFAAFRNESLQGELHVESFEEFGEIFFPFLKSFA